MGKILSRGIVKEMEQYKKTVTQLLVSVSLFSLVFSCSSLSSTSALILYYEKLCYLISWNSLQLLSIAMNKNCVFLICNGILVFLAKTSAFVRSPSGYDLNDMLQKRIGDELQVEELQPLSDENGGSTEEDEEESDEEDEEESDEEDDEKSNEEDGEFECVNERGEEVSISIAKSDHEEEVKNDESEPKNFWLFDDDNEGGEEGEGEGGGGEEEEVYAEEEEDETEKLSTEELNQKFEDFIRRMKKEFRIDEAQQQLVMVN